MLNILMLLIMMGLDIMYIITKSLFWKTLASTTFVTIGFISFNTCIKNKNDLSFPFWMMAEIMTKRFLENRFSCRVLWTVLYWSKTVLPYWTSKRTE